MADSYAFLAGKNVYGSEQLTVSTSALPLTIAKVNNTANALNNKAKAQAAVLQAVANACYYTLDGTTPSGSNGKLLSAGETLPLAGYQKVKQFQAIRSGGSDCVLHVDYYA